LHSRLGQFKSRPATVSVLFMKSPKYVLSKSILQECVAGQSTVTLATTRRSQFLFFVTGLFTACHVMIANTALFMGLVSPVAGFSVAGFSRSLERKSSSTHQNGKMLLTPARMETRSRGPRRGSTRHRRTLLREGLQQSEHSPISGLPTMKARGFIESTPSWGIKSRMAFRTPRCYVLGGTQRTPAHGVRTSLNLIL
jgi:hypothetical protein